MKRIVILLLICLFFLPICVHADSGHSTIVMDADSGRILYDNNSHERKLIASITKIMTCVVVLENFDIEDSITVGDEVLSMYGTNIYIEPGEKMKVIDLLYGLILRSGNDAAISLAVNTLGEDEFIEKMNETAKKIGMSNTIFKNPHGLDDSDDKNYSTAYDMALLSIYAYKNPKYREIISTKKYVTSSSLKSYVWYNRMSLINSYKYCVGGKNGYTPKAGKTLVSYAKKDNLTLTIVSLDDDSTYENHKNLYSTYFSKYKNYTIIDKDNFKIKNVFDDYNYYVKKSFKYPLSTAEVSKINTLVKLDNYVSKKNIGGEVDILLEDEKIGTVKIYRKKKEKKENNSLFQKIVNLFIR